jgi:N6-adenosine-specific RNA methylase IME4
VKYRTICADPPWPYVEGTSVTIRSVEVERRGGKSFRHPLPYGWMSVPQITVLPVGELADDDAHLYLWTTQRFLRDAFDIVEILGFQPSATLVWCKAPRGWTPGGPYMSTVEFVLFCQRGSLATKTRVRSQWFNWPRSRHSAKPEAFIDMVEQVSPGPYVELFARRHRLGWDVIGDAMDFRDIREVLSA